MILNGLPWKWTEIILLFLRLYLLTAFRTLVNYEGYSISFKGFLPTVDTMVWYNSFEYPTTNLSWERWTHRSCLSGVRMPGIHVKITLLPMTDTGRINYRGFILPQRKLEILLGCGTDANSRWWLPRSRQLDSQVRSLRRSCPAVGIFTTSLLRSLPFILSSQSITSLIIRSCQVSICPGHFLLSNSSCSR